MSKTFFLEYFSAIEARSIDETLPYKVAEFQTEAGGEITRSLSTTGDREINLSMVVNSAGYSALETTFETTAKMGAARLPFVHPISYRAGAARFTEAPRIRDIGIDYFRVAIALRVRLTNDVAITDDSGAFVVDENDNVVTT